MEGNPPVMNEIPSQSSKKRFRVIWRAFLIANFALGAYIFTRPTKKERLKEKSETPAAAAEVPPPPPAVVSPPPPREEPVIAPPPPPPVAKPVIVRDPIPDDQQREIFRWILEEKRKIKPQNKEEKKRIDEEKSILKQFIRSESIPKI